METILGNQIHFYYILDFGKVQWLETYFSAKCDSEFCGQRPDIKSYPLHMKRAVLTQH